MRSLSHRPATIQEARQPSYGRRLLSRLAEYEWSLVGLVALFTVALAATGFASYFADQGNPRSPLDTLYLTLQLFALESGSVPGPLPVELDVARFLAAAVIGYAAFKALVVVFREEIQRHRIRFFRGHVVVCGLGQKGIALVRDFTRSGYRVVGIDGGAVSSQMKRGESYGAPVLEGDATDPGALVRAATPKAAYVFAVCGDDSTNAEIAVRVREVLDPSRRTVLTCFVHVKEPDLIRLLREREITTQESDALRLEFFNVYESGVRVLLNAHPPFDSGSENHVLIVGSTPAATALIVQTGKLWHVLERSDRPHRLQLTLVDQSADSQVALLTTRYPQLGQVCDIEPCSADLESPDFLDASLLYGGNRRRPITAAYICLDDDARGFRAALTIRQRLADRHIPIVIATRHEAGLAELLRGNASSGQEFSNLAGFGIVDRACRNELLLGGTHEILARAMHASYVRERREHGETRATNPSVAPWEDLPETLRDSNRRQADHIGIKLQAIGRRIGPLDDWDARLENFDPDEIERLARMEHDRWVDERKSEGWTYGPAKDVERKISPYLIPWDDARLGKEIKDVDRRFAQELPRFLAKAGFAILPPGRQDS